MPRKRIKRENGTGSVYKRSEIKRRPWVAVAPAELVRTAATGKVNARQMIIGHYATAQEAKDALDEYRRNPTTKFNITLEQLHDEWAKIAYRPISKQTKDNYDACWLKLEPLYTKKFRDIRTAQMQAIIDLYSGMSQSMLSKMKTLLTQLYDYAIQNDVVGKNYARFIVLPKREKTEKDCFSVLEPEKIESRWFHPLCRCHPDDALYGIPGIRVFRAYTI